MAAPTFANAVVGHQLEAVPAPALGTLGRVFAALRAVAIQIGAVVDGTVVVVIAGAGAGHGCRRCATRCHHRQVRIVI